MLGFGRIGRQVARRAVGLQMKVVAYDPFVSAERFRELGVDSASFDEVLARADFLTLHLPLTDDTRNADRRRGDRAGCATVCASSTPPAASWSTRRR